MSEHRFEGPDGRIWQARERAEGRRDDGDQRLVIELDTLGERRVVVCLRGEWDTPDPDLRELLARSIPAGASRGLEQPPASPEQEVRGPDEPLTW